MRILILNLFCFLITTNISGQNLVPNPSFEDTTNCFYWPPLAGTPWFSPTGGTPDYFNQIPTCGTLLTGGLSGWGDQLPRTGTAYSGFYAWLSTTREYLEVKLSDTLNVGSTYLIKFYVSRSECFGVAIDRIGAHLSDTLVHSSPNNGFYLPLTPQIENAAGDIIRNSLSWRAISGTYTANGNETYLTIGVFQPTSALQFDTISLFTTCSPNSYYFIDDVSVTLLTPQAINTSIHQNDISVVHFKDVLTISTEVLSPFSIYIYDLSGRQISQHTFTDQLEISTADLPRGMYVYRILNGTAQVKTDKIILE